MRAREKIAGPKDFESFLRRNGFSQKEAKMIVSLTWKSVSNVGVERKVIKRTLHKK